MAEVNLLNARYDPNAPTGLSSRSAFVDRALASVRLIPGVQMAAITDNMPLAGENSVFSVYRPDHPLPPGQEPTADLRNVSLDYFAAMQIPLIAGNDFGARVRDHPNDAIISQKIAQAAWPDENPLGRTFHMNGRAYTVLGIAADARVVSLKQNVPVVYLPYWHDPSPTIFFLVRSSLPFDTLAPTIRRELWDIDPEIAIPTLESLSTQVSESLTSDRFEALVLSAFSIAALILAALGIYGVLAHSVSSRSPEFGLRIALGSSKRALVGLIVREASRPVLVGIALGTLAAFASTRVIRSMLYETAPLDPVAIFTSAAILTVVAVAAALLPAFRASRSDPMKVLHEP